MPAVKAVLGHVHVETAKAKRKCSRHKTGKAAHPISKNEQCLVVLDANGSKHNYCPDSAAEILNLAETNLASLRADLGL